MQWKLYRSQDKALELTNHFKEEPETFISGTHSQLGQHVCLRSFCPKTHLVLLTRIQIHSILKKTT